MKREENAVAAAVIALGLGAAPRSGYETAGPVPGGVRPVCESRGRGLSFPADSCCQALALAI